MYLVRICVDTFKFNMYIRKEKADVIYIRAFATFLKLVLINYIILIDVECKL